MEKDLYYPNDLTNIYLDDQKNFDLLSKDLENLKNDILRDFPAIIHSPSFKPLDLDSRKEDPTRQFKHIHQMCIPLVKKYIISTKVKVLNLIDGFNDSYKKSNHLICFFLARYSIELNSIVHRINIELTRFHNADNKDWLTKGESFFWEIFRANFGSRHDRFKDVIRKYENISKKKMMPLDLNKSMEILSKNNDSFKNLSDEYDFFSDYVHHNAPSITSTVSAHTHIDKPTLTIDGLILPKGTYIEEYKYPQTRHHRLLHIALYSFKKHIFYLLGVLEEFPFSPFSEELRIEKTGHPSGYGFRPFKQNQNKFNDKLEKTGRNQRCPCGSNKKFKNCCMTK